MSKDSHMRKIDGKYYDHFYFEPSKAGSETAASHLRNRGYSVRVTKSAYGYEVWGRPRGYR